MSPNEFSLVFKHFTLNPDISDYQQEFVLENSPEGILFCSCDNQALEAEHLFYENAEPRVKAAVNTLASNHFLSNNNDHMIESRQRLLDLLEQPSQKWAKRLTFNQLRIFLSIACSASYNLIQEWEEVWDRVRAKAIEQIFEEQTKELMGTNLIDSIFQTERPSKASSTASPRTMASTTFTAPYRQILMRQTKMYASVITKLTQTETAAMQIPELPEEDNYLNLEPLYLKYVKGDKTKFYKVETEFLESVRKIKAPKTRSRVNQEHSVKAISTNNTHMNTLHSHAQALNHATTSNSTVSGVKKSRKFSENSIGLRSVQFAVPQTQLISVQQVPVDVEHIVIQQQRSSEEEERYQRKQQLQEDMPPTTDLRLQSYFPPAPAAPRADVNNSTKKHLKQIDSASKKKQKQATISSTCCCSVF